MRWFVPYLVLIGCADMAESLTKQTDPTCPFDVANDVYAQVQALAWDLTGTYLAVGGVDDDSDEWFAWYKRSGDTLTKLTDPGTMPDASVSGLAWDSDASYLAVTQEWYGGWYALILYSRSGDTLTQEQYYDDPPYAGVGEMAWDGSYLIVASHYQDAGPWNSNTHSLAVYSRSGSSLSLGNTYGPQGKHTGLAISPDGNWLATMMEEYTGNDHVLRVWSWDGAGALTLAGSYSTGTTGDRYRLSWDSTGEYIAVGTSNDTDGNGFLLFKWDASGETISAPTLSDQGLGEFTGWDVQWHPSAPYLLVVGQPHSSGDDSVIRIYSRSGDILTHILTYDHSDAAIGYAARWHPDADWLAFGHDDGNYLSIYAASGFEDIATGSASLAVPLLVRIGPKGDYEIFCPLYTSVGDVPIPGDYEKSCPLFVQVGE